MKSKSVIGVDLGGTNIRVGKVVDYSIVDLFSRHISSDGTEKEIIEEVIDSIKKIIDGSVIGIGVGVPSVVDVEKGIIYNVQNIPSWKEVKLKEILENEFQVPVYINNDANCFVVGEKYFGIGKNYDNIVGLIIGTGLGSGFYFDNKQYVGANCGAGEFGMISYKDKNYEYYCSGQFFENEYKIAGDELFKLAKNNDKKALAIFNEFGHHLGNALTTILFAVDPEIIILGGSVSKSYEFYKNSVYEVLNKFPYPGSIRNLKIVVSRLSQVAILGAAALYYEYRGITASVRDLEIIKDSVE